MTYREKHLIETFKAFKKEYPNADDETLCVAVASQEKSNSRYIADLIKTYGTNTAK